MDQNSGLYHTLKRFILIPRDIRSQVCLWMFVFHSYLTLTTSHIQHHGNFLVSKLVCLGKCTQVWYFFDDILDASVLWRMLSCKVSVLLIIPCLALFLILVFRYHIIPQSTTSVTQSIKYSTILLPARFHLVITPINWLLRVLLKIGYSFKEREWNELAITQFWIPCLHEENTSLVFFFFFFVPFQHFDGNDISRFDSFVTKLGFFW